MNRQSEYRWTEVRRKKSIRKSNNGEITTFFVSKLPTVVNREKIRTKFARYGRVTNVYLANKKDSGGNNFAFIMFSNVRNAKELEKYLNGISFLGTLSSKKVNTCDGVGEGHNQQVNPDGINHPQVTGAAGTTGKGTPCLVEENEHIVVGEDEQSPNRQDITNVNNNWNPKFENVPVDMQADPGKKETNIGLEVNLVSLGCFGPFPSIAHQDTMSGGPNNKGPNNRRSKRRRVDSGGGAALQFPTPVIPLILD
ncbi:hypothetical protein L2E82_17125 [Cichorium intybus]|uniref:Uncharacterized protein n=1 Tax=Cichorium intybus TaxID=13427 RepID=A0ACB9F7F9_CICIN|nr:hypothetical protein L2E82_17125 [Cichorium intybus]